ncbi:MAG: hypothetical protein HDQ97_12390 [Lachnospiraceae bacterium]|nr:hypothetical protein [Lachnospiraceae bacterium]
MQIRNDFTSFSGREYQNSHTHHITKCLHEEEHKRQEAAASGMKQGTADSAASQKTQQDVVFEHGIGTGKQASQVKKGLGTLRDIWDSMGDEKGKEDLGALPVARESFFHNSINTVSLAFRAVISDRIVNKWESARERIKVNIKSALKRFSKNRDTFSTLSDPKGRFTGKKDTEEQYNQRPGKGTRRKEADLRTAVLSDTHLMDSYSKTGEYCRLNENLTYQKNKMAERSETLDKPL